MDSFGRRGESRYGSLLNPCSQLQRCCPSTNNAIGVSGRQRLQTL